MYCLNEGWNYISVTKFQEKNFTVGRRKSKFAKNNSLPKRKNKKKTKTKHLKCSLTRAKMNP